MTTLGERLKLAREKTGLKQTQVKEKTNINNKTLSGYENGVSEPDANTLSILAELYEVSYKWLLSGDGQMKNNFQDQLKPSEERDIIRDLQKIIDGIEGGYAAYDGKTPEEIEDHELLKASLEQSMRLAKRMAKDKFTPNKYKK